MAVINTNISSLNAQRNLSMSQSSLSTSLQRLSSGLRINSAKDDAAGLSITARMTSQIKGMDQAVRNANDAISLSQTAEGALSESTNLLQRMRELSIQSANATNSAGDRKSLQSEVNQLKSELDRIANTTNFNGNKLLDGSFTSQNFQIGADANQTIGISVSGATGTILGVNSLVTNNVGGITAATGSGTPTATTNGTGMGTSTAGTSATAALTTALPSQTITVTDSAGATTTHAITAGGTSASAFAMAASLTGGSGITSATANANAAVLDFTNTTVDVGDTVSFSLAGDDTTSPVSVSFTSTGQTNLKADAMTAIGLIAMPTGVTAAAGTGNTINLASAAGHNIAIQDFAVSNAATMDLDGFTGFNATSAGTINFTGAGANSAFNATYTFTLNGVSKTATVADGGTAAVQTGSVALTAIKDQSAASANARTFDLTVNGTTQSIVVSATNFANSAALAANVQTQINTAFGSGSVTVGVDGSDHLTLTTAAKGVNAALTVAETGAHTGATALFGGPLAIANGTGTVTDAQVATAFRTAIATDATVTAGAVASGAFTISQSTADSGTFALGAITQGVFKGTTDITANISAGASNAISGAGAGTWASVSGAANTLTASNVVTLNVGATPVTVTLTGIKTDASIALQKAAIATAFDTGLTAAGVAHTATIAGSGSHIALTGLTGATGSKVFTGTSTGAATGTLTITNSGNSRGTTSGATNNGTLTFNGTDSETYTNAYVGTVQFGAAALGSTLTEGSNDSAVKTSTVDVVLAAGATIKSNAANSVFNSAANTNVGSVTGLSDVTGGNNVAAQTLTIVGSSSATATINADATAKNIAAAVNAQSATTAVTAKATTSATLSNLSANGTVSFSLYGSNTTAVSVSATVTTGDLTALAKSINDKTGNTGITATLSSAGTSISLVNDQGYDIGIENFTHSASTGSVEQNLRVTGTSGDPVTLRNGNSTTGDSTVIGGKVTFSSSEASFSVQSSIAASAGGLFTGGALAAQASTLSSVSTIDVSTAAGAQSAIDVIDGALASVNSIRASLGALQNRFTSTISSLQTTSENITSARSRIQDADFASETASLTRGQILQQAGTAMLAQANSLPNGVLALLRG